MFEGGGGFGMMWMISCHQPNSSSNGDSTIAVAWPIVLTLMHPTHENVVSACLIARVLGVYVLYVCT